MCHKIDIISMSSIQLLDLIILLGVNLKVPSNKNGEQGKIMGTCHRLLEECLRQYEKGLYISPKKRCALISACALL